MNNKKNLICFLGLKNTGKGYNSDFYIEKGFVKISMADSLRDILWGILEYKPNDKLTYDDFKNGNFGIKKTLFNFIPLFNKIITGRKMLQNIGSVMKKYFGDDFWVKLWVKKVLETEQDVVCDDIRFPNEIKKAISLEKKGYNVSFIWVCYEKANFNEILKDTHESEKLSQYLYYNQKKYGLYDLCKINDKTMNTILKDFTKENKKV